MLAKMITLGDLKKYSGWEFEKYMLEVNKNI